MTGARWGQAARALRAGASGGGIFLEKEIGRLALAAALGAVMSAGGAVTWLALCAALVVVRGGWRWFAVGLGYFAVSLRWIVEPFFVDAAATGWMAPFAIVFMAGGLAAFWGVAGRIGRGAVGIAVALWWAEAARALVLTGFPWADFGMRMVETPVAWALPLGGPRGAALVLLAAAAVVAVLPRRAAVVGAVLGAVVLVLPGPGAVVPGDGPLVRVVQPNTPQEEKWLPEVMPLTFDRMVSLTRGGGPAALTLWPEMATAYDLSQGRAREVVEEAARGGAVIAGGPEFVGEFYFNALVAVEPGRAVQTYRKTHLVPFGEYLPRFVSWLGLEPLATGVVGDYSAGAGPALIEVAGIGAVRPLICYEGIFAEEVRQPARARLLVLATNDAWFGTGPGPRQHLVQARMRALELGVPVVRSAGTGISAIIDARGHVVASVPLGEAGQVAAPLPAVLGPTPYARWGEAPVFALMALITVITLLVDRRHKGG